MSRKNPRVLVVEDEALTALSIAEHLRLHGYDVLETVSTGEQAVKAAETQRPDIIFMDIRLSGKMDGIEAADAIRKIFLVPVAFISGYSNKETIERAYKTSPVAFLAKPLIMQKLIDAIERYALK